MQTVDTIALVAGYVLLPAAVVIAGGFVLTWLEHRYNDRNSAAEHTREHRASSRAAWTAWAVPFAALTAAMVLAPVVFAVVAVASNELAVGYLGTVGFALGALALNGLAATTEQTPAVRLWSSVPGVLLSSAVGFTIALISFLGAALSGTLGVSVRDPRRFLVSIGVMLVVGGLALAAYRKRQRDNDRVESASEKPEVPVGR